MNKLIIVSMALMLTACNSSKTNLKKEADEFMAMQPNNYYVVTLSDALEEVNARSNKYDY